MEVEVEVTITRAVGNLTFASSDSDAAHVLLAHLPGFDKDEIEVLIDEQKTEICISGEGREGSLQAVLLSRLHVTRETGRESFSEVFEIPDGVVLEWIKTWFDEEKGILVVLMPKLIREEELEQEEYVENLEPKEKFEDAKKMEEEIDEGEPIPCPKPPETKPSSDDEEPKERQTPAGILDEPLEILLNSGDEKLEDNEIPTITSTQPEEPEQDSNQNGQIPIIETPIQAPEHQEPTMVPKSTPDDDGIVEQLEVPITEEPNQSTDIDEIPMDDTPIRPQLDEEMLEKLKIPTEDEIAPEGQEPIEPPETDLEDKNIEEIPMGDTPIRPQLDEETLEELKIPTEDEIAQEGRKPIEPPETNLEDEKIEDLKLPEEPNGNFQEEEDESGVPNAETPYPAPETATELEDSDTSLEKPIDEAQVPIKPPETNLDDEKFEDPQIPNTKPAELVDTDHTSQHEDETETPTDEKPTNEAQPPIIPSETNLDDEKFEDLELPTTKPSELEETNRNSEQEDETEAPAAETLDPSPKTEKSTEFEEPDVHSEKKGKEITDEADDQLARDDDPKERERELAGKERGDGSEEELGFGGEERMREIGTRERERREPLSLSPVSILAGSAFILSLVVLMFHFLKERKRQ